MSTPLSAWVLYYSEFDDWGVLGAFATQEAAEAECKRLQDPRLDFFEIAIQKAGPLPLWFRATATLCDWSQCKHPDGVRIDLDKTYRVHVATPTPFSDLTLDQLHEKSDQLNIEYWQVFGETPLQALEKLRAFVGDRMTPEFDRAFREADDD